MSRFGEAVRALPLAFLVVLVAGACGGGGDDSAPSSGTMDLAKDKPAFTVTLPPGDLQGGTPNALATGDFNGDGKLDLLLGAPYSDGPDSARTDAGEAYIIYGPIDNDIDLAQREPDVRILGSLDGDMLGAGVAAGDLNGDGIDDVVVGAPGSNGLQDIRTDMGEAYVVFGGKSLPASVDTKTSQENFDFQPAEGFSQVGKTFAVADVNGDSIGDLIIGAPYAGRQEGTPAGSPRTTVGEVYVVFGGHDLGGFATVVKNDQDVRLSGVKGYDQFGYSVAAGDVNGDGVADVIVGASGYDGLTGTTEDAGGVFVYYGSSGLSGHKTETEADLTIAGQDAGDALGTLVAEADVTGDGRAEIVSVAPDGAGPTNDRFASGETIIYDPSTYSGPATGITADTAARVYAPTASELLAGSLAVTGGTKPLLALGSTMRATADRTGAGWAYLLPAAVKDSDLNGATDALSIEGAAAGDGLGGSVTFGDLDGDGKPELLAEATGGTQSMGVPDTSFRARVYVIRPG